jgi:hypothetical protein
LSIGKADAEGIRGVRRQMGLTPPRSLSQSARRLRQDLVVADRPSRPDPGTPRSSPKLQETKGMARSNPDGAHISADDGEDGSQDETVWEHGPLLNYKVVNGKPLVLVPWYPT